jgi:beta propeller repeat protein
MKDKSKLHSAALASVSIVLFLIVVLSTVSASIGGNSYKMTSTNICIETRITNNESEQSYPSIYENRIVWMDNRNGNWDI